MDAWYRPWPVQIFCGQAKDVTRGLQSKVEKGHYPQRAFPGYKNDTDNHTIVVDPDRFNLLRKAMEHILYGGCTPLQALDMLNNEWGFRTAPRQRTGGGPLSRSAFYRILSNRFYTGNFVYNGELHKGQHEALLSLAEFEDLQSLC